MSHPTIPNDLRLSRRQFTKTLGLAATAPRFLASTETAVSRFYASLNSDQRAQICFPTDHPLRLRVAPHWAIVKPRINDLKPAQIALCHEIFENLCRDDGHAQFMRQMDDDDGGFQNYHVAVFGQPHDPLFEWVLTGRHATLRADGHDDRASFHGPIFYGHAAESPSRNVWSHQAKQATMLFESLDHHQKTQALVSWTTPSVVGLAVATLDDDQRLLVDRLVSDILQPFRGIDTVEPRPLTFAQHGYSGVWTLEGPGFSWYFHGSPHVHAWLEIDAV